MNAPSPPEAHVLLIAHSKNPSGSDNIDGIMSSLDAYIYTFDHMYAITTSLAYNKISFRRRESRKWVTMYFI